MDVPNGMEMELGLNCEASELVGTGRFSVPSSAARATGSLATSARNKGFDAVETLLRRQHQQLRIFNVFESEGARPALSSS